MSGTSLDGIDVACCRFSPSFKLLAQHHLPMPDTLRKMLLTLQAPSDNEIHLAMQAAQTLTQCYHESVMGLLHQHRIDKNDVRALGCHGQTIRHRPADGYTLQLNQPALLAELCDIDVIADFRSRDVAAQGQGAPLVPAFHEAVFRKPGTHRVIVNVGGMANLTDLPDHGPTSGFDCGPGNVLMDGWVKKECSMDFDEGGRWAASGTVIPSLLEALLAHPFFAALPPKSCGREEFNLTWLSQYLTEQENPADVQATLLELTAQGIAQSIARECPGSNEIYVCGGGAKNQVLMARMTALLPAHQVSTSDQLELPVDAVEAAAFAWLAKAFLAGEPGNLATVTGAKGPRILGALYPARIRQSAL